ncbi:hypothetical protein [Microbacterium sp.]|uniref:hypothetical protein n=1 Tax=Microbacterium sp. TaxID=51671 RepID=UPI0039E57310
MIAEDERIVKSRHRVKTYGEVFTPRRMVEQMLDLVRTELETGPHFVDKTFFEPAAGDGNFLVAILLRKLKAIEKRYQASRWPSESLFALASIYAVEFLHDNHEAAKGNVLDVFLAFHRSHGVSCGARTNLRRAAEHLVSTNILHGNTLTGLDPEGRALEFSWWIRSSDESTTVRRTPFTLASLRGGGFDFTVYESYAPCRIDHVHKEVRADG